MAVFFARAVTVVAAALAAVGCLLGAVSFLIAALYLYLLSRPLAPGMAALLVGLALLGAGLMILLIGRLISVGVRARRLGRAAGRPSAGERQLGSIIGELGGELGGRTAREAVAATEAHPYGATGFAFLVGLALGVSPDLQKLVTAALSARDADASRTNSQFSPQSR